jgi:hypothetical protein
MFRSLSLLGIVAVAFGVAALASLTPAPKTLPANDKGPRRRPYRPAYTRMPGLQYHLAFSMN